MIADGASAARTLVRQTPLVSSAQLGCWLKLESLQRTGSFKLRGAVIALARLFTDGHRKVVAASAGNHGLGIALAGATLGMSVIIFVPTSAAKKKREGIAALGAELQLAGAGYDEAEVAAKAYANEHNLPLVSPFDDEGVILGNGRWLAQEIVAQRPSLKRIITPVGGGGLVSGLLLELQPRGIEVVGVQPEGARAMSKSLAEGAPRLTDNDTTVCTGLDGGVALRTFEIARRHALRIVTVAESSVLPAVAFAYRSLGLIVEPAAAVVIAAAAEKKVPVDEDTVLLITGRNVDEALLDAALSLQR